jgi:hypothetical protein
MLLPARNVVSLNLIVCGIIARVKSIVSISGSVACAIGDRNIVSTNLVDRSLTTATSKDNLPLKNSAFLIAKPKALIETA